MYVHNSAAVPRAQFYGVNYKASIKFIFNPNVSLQKNFKTINCDIKNLDKIETKIIKFKPDIIIHIESQPILK